MTSLNTLKNVLYKLKKEEIRSLKNFINYNQKETKEMILKSIRLIDIVLSDKTCASNDLQITLYGRINYSAFNKLVSRLKDKVYEILLFDNNIERNVLAKRNRVIFNIRKKLIQSEIMFARGINDELEKFQNKIISTAKEYEVFDSLLEALHAKQRYLGFRYGSAIYRKVKSEIDFYEKSRMTTIKARELFNEITTKINFSTSPSDYQENLKEAINILEKDYESTKSSTIGYYYMLLKTEQHQNQAELTKAQETLFQLRDLIETNVSVYTKYRVGITTLNIANNELLMHNFKNCISFAHDSINYFTDNRINIGLSKEIEFFALFYSGKFENAEKLIFELYNFSRTSKTPFLYSKRAYLLACMNTLSGEFSKSNELLAEVSEIERDKEGWNIWKRILTIINRIETKDFESVDLHVQNLQRHIKRTLKTKHVLKRDILILRILLKLINEHFDFQKVHKSRRRYFELLESKDTEYSWKIKSPELIVFHEWFKCKMENRKYDNFLAGN